MHVYDPLLDEFYLCRGLYLLNNTAKLPSILRIYRDTLTADMKSAIKTAVAELLPVLASRGSESEFFSGDRSVEAD
ncbi:vacuolar protein sorting-associated protein 54-like, partial [Trifolium medium]|nr:vacuolar protein sorting-associated protein 54-like [Trifolium medium]